MVSPRTRKAPRAKLSSLRRYCRAESWRISSMRSSARALADRHRRARIGLHRADAVDARHRGHDDHVVALQDRPRRRMAHAVDLLVHRGILFDIGVGARDIGFRLVVVVIGNEILHRVLGEEVLHLGVELGGQRFVGRQDQRRALHDLDHLGHGEGLARAGDAEQHLVALAERSVIDDAAFVLLARAFAGAEALAPGR